jgi:hypothetical protein
MPRQAIRRETVTTTTIVTTSTSTPFKVNDAKTISVQAVVDVNTPSAKAFAAGTADVKTLTFEAFADIVDREYFVVYSQDGQAWAIYFDKTGTSIAPTGAIYTAIPASNKAKADISGDTTAAQVAARVETAIDALTGFTALIVTDDSAANGTMTFTQTSHGTVSVPVSKLLDDSSVGGMTSANTTPGVASDVNVTDNTIAEATHGYPTGLKGQVSSTATLPAGLSAATDYFVIATTANTYKLATSLANAQAGTAIDITNQGTSAATHTFTPTSLAGASLTLQKSNNYNPITGTGDFDAVESATSITADADIWISDVDPEYEWCRLSYTLTAGSLSAASYILIKGDV